MSDTASPTEDQVPTVAHAERVMARSIRELWGVNNSHAIAQTTFRALNEAGYVIVPREPTREMCDLAERALRHPIFSTSDAAKVWRAMIDRALG